MNVGSISLQPPSAVGAPPQRIASPGDFDRTLADADQRASSASSPGTASTGGSLSRDAKRQSGAPAAEDAQPAQDPSADTTTTQASAGDSADVSNPAAQVAGEQRQKETQTGTPPQTPAPQKKQPSVDRASKASPAQPPVDGATKASSPRPSVTTTPPVEGVVLAGQGSTPGKTDSAGQSGGQTEASSKTPLGPATPDDSGAADAQSAPAPAITQSAAALAPAQSVSAAAPGRIAAAQVAAQAIPSAKTQQAGDVGDAGPTGKGKPVVAKAGPSGSDSAKDSGDDTSADGTSAAVKASGSTSATAQLVKISADPSANSAPPAPSVSPPATAAGTPHTTPVAAANTPPAPAPQDPDADANIARIARGLQSALRQNGGVVTLRLSPPELGMVKISLEISNGVVKADLQADQESVRDLLTHQLGQLRQGLENRGLSVERLEVGSPAPASNPGQGQQSGQANDDGRSRGQFFQQRGGSNPQGSGGQSGSGTSGGGGENSDGNSRGGATGRPSGTFGELMVNTVA